MGTLCLLIVPRSPCRRQSQPRLRLRVWAGSEMHLRRGKCAVCWGMPAAHECSGHLYPQPVSGSTPDSSMIQITGGKLVVPNFNFCLKGCSGDFSEGHPVGAGTSTWFLRDYGRSPGVMRWRARCPWQGLSFEEHGCEQFAQDSLHQWK